MSLRSIHKRFGANHVIRGLDLDVSAGECIALAGENGSGKSTVAKIMSGVEQPTSGRVVWNGTDVRLASPRTARGLGIAVIPQELAYIGGLNALENIALATWPKNAVLTSNRRYLAHVGDALDELGLKVDLRAPMESLTLAERQSIEIAKALLHKARLIILDEPTAALHRPEAARLLRLLATCKQNGVALIYISHHFDECFEIAERFTVLRNGSAVATLPARSTSREEIVSHMLGPEYTQPSAAARTGGGEGAPVLRLTGWTSARVPALHGIDLDVRQGEVVAMFGILGSGAETLARSLGGHQRGTSGHTEVSGLRMRGAPGSAAAARRLGIAYVPAERKSEGIAEIRPVSEHLTLMTPGRVSRFGIVSRRREEALATRLTQDFGVRCGSVRQPVGELSGGNQQKVLLASRVSARPRVLLLHEPTRGVDVAARAFIHHRIVDAARDGAAVLIVTCDVAEAVAVADRVVVMRGGRVVRELRGQDKNEKTALAVATGGDHD
ncbi:sugar ABC transporter ATP-binding protein [Nonomuraea sp. NPDC049400]|uniref:sugar ABC transporter ATP-binding protein n=1 Tax=Nonomuraea sp. NPDC049400 TaxID=3364352 RepID=UPI0037998420